MRKGTVCFGHAVTVFLLLKGGTGFIVGVDDFGLKALGIGHTTASASGGNDPHHCKVKLAMASDWEWDLVISATDTARLNFEVWADVCDSLFENLNWVFAV